jgi:hypothetical protein
MEYLRITNYPYALRALRYAEIDDIEDVWFLSDIIHHDTHTFKPSLHYIKVSPVRRTKAGLVLFHTALPIKFLVPRTLWHERYFNHRENGIYRHSVPLSRLFVDRYEHDLS